jgi:hypothetical protein
MPAEEGGRRGAGTPNIRVWYGIRGWAYFTPQIFL